MPPRAAVFARSFGVLVGSLFLLVIIGLWVPAVYRFWTLPLGELAIPHFGDSDMFLAGADVLRDNGGRFSWDAVLAHGAPYNYPRLWSYLGWLGLGQEQKLGVGVVLAALLLGTQFILLRPNDGRTWAWAALMLLSPACLLLMDRGNNDALIFALLLGATALLARDEEGAPAAFGGAGLLLAAACLKFYPIAAVAALPFRRERWRRGAAVAGALLVLFAVYAFAVREDLRQVSVRTPRPYHATYGALVPASFLAHSLELRAALARMGVDLSDPARMARVAGAARVGGLLAALALGGGAFLAGVRAVGRGGWTLAPPGLNAVRFRAGAAIYGGTFLIGNNFDYRLVFLGFTVPALFAARRDGGAACRRWVDGTLALVVVNLWAALASHRPWLFVFTQLAHWTLLVVLAHLAGRVVWTTWVQREGTRGDAAGQPSGTGGKG